VNYVFRPVEERKTAFANAIRYGHPDSERALKDINIATALVRDLADNGGPLSNQIEARFHEGADAIPAEIIADFASSATFTNDATKIAKSLEFASHLKELPSSDALEAVVKSFLGVVLDFVEVGRPKFATSWISRSGDKFLLLDTEQGGQGHADALPLFDK